MLLHELLWGRGKTTTITDLERERDRLRAKNTDFEKELASERYRIEELEAELKKARASLNQCEADKATINAQLSRARSMSEAASPTVASSAGAVANNLVSDRTDNDRSMDNSAVGNTNLATGGGLNTNPDDLSQLNGMSEDAIAIYKANGIHSISDLKNANEDDLAGYFTDSKHNYYFAQQQANLHGSDMKAYLEYRLNNYAMALRNDNLQVVEGIGPKIEGLLKADGIRTWGMLARTSTDDLKAILNKAGKRYQMHNPKTWPEQADLANKKEWEKLYNFQKFLDTGRDTGSDNQTPAKIEKIMIRILGIKSSPDDLKVVEGIGPKIEGLLKADGIQNWSDLATTAVDRLQGILDKAGNRYKLARPSTWPKQAALARDGKWAELKEYQDFLQGGNDPTA